ncbi:MAG: hypothetical protein RL254_798 [Planctomycetota bacterium]|jgi:hypothetical protein
MTRFILTLILANEIRGLIIAAPSLWALSSVSPALVWSAVAFGIVLSLVVPVLMVRRISGKDQK